MPDYIRNHVKIYGRAEDVSALIKLVLNDKEKLLFDFEKIVPSPGDLEVVTSGPYDSDYIKLWKNEHNERNDKDFVDGICELGFSYEESLDWGRKLLRNEILYGERDWYDWRMKHWGTKWNAMGVTMTYQGSCEVDYEFDTANTFPEEIYLSLSAQFPDLQIDVEFAHEDIGAYCGAESFRGGSGETYFVNEKQFACDVWGINPDEIKEK